jgi:hypothetical protein
MSVWVSQYKEIVHPLTQNDSQHLTQNESSLALKDSFQACGQIADVSHSTPFARSLRFWTVKELVKTVLPPLLNNT